MFGVSSTATDGRASSPIEVPEDIFERGLVPGIVAPGCPVIEKVTGTPPRNFADFAQRTASAWTGGITQ
jgi:hypothetical protein